MSTSDTGEIFITKIFKPLLMCMCVRERARPRACCERCVLLGPAGVGVIPCTSPPVGWREYQQRVRGRSCFLHISVLAEVAFIGRCSQHA